MCFDWNIKKETFQNKRDLGPVILSLFIQKERRKQTVINALLCVCLFSSFFLLLIFLRKRIWTIPRFTVPAHPRRCAVFVSLFLNKVRVCVLFVGGAVDLLNQEKRTKTEGGQKQKSWELVVLVSRWHPVHVDSTVRCISIGETVPLESHLPYPRRLVR